MMSSSACLLMFLGMMSCGSREIFPDIVRTRDASQAGDASWEPDVRVSPDAEGARVEHPELSVTEPVRMDEAEGNRPSVHVISEQVFAFYNDRGADETRGTLRLRRCALGSSRFDDAIDIVTGGSWVDLRETSEGLEAIINMGQRAGLYRAGPTGTGWELTTDFGASSSSCFDPLPACFFRGDDTDDHIAIGYHYQSGIFGCVQETSIATIVSDGWIEADIRYNGWPAAAFSSFGRHLFVSEHAIYVSPDSAGFEEVTDGDTTATQIRGSGAVMSGSQLLVVQTFGYASEQRLALIKSDDFGATWHSRTILQTNDSMLRKSRIAADDGWVFVAWLECRDGAILGSYHRVVAMVMYSPDNGSTWSHPAQLSQTGEDQNIDSLAITSRGSEAVVMYGATGENIAYEFEGVFIANVSD